VPELRRCHPADRVDHGGGADRPEVLTLQIKGSRSAGRPLWKGHWPDYPFLGLAAGYKPVASSYLAQIWWLSPFPVPTFGKRENMVFSASFGQKKEVLFLTEWHEEKCEKA